MLLSFVCHFNSFVSCTCFTCAIVTGYIKGYVPYLTCLDINSYLSLVTRAAAVGL